jgi:hypothetical protein
MTFCPLTPKGQVPGDEMARISQVSDRGRTLPTRAPFSFSQKRISSFLIGTRE